MIKCELCNDDAIKDEKYCVECMGEVQSCDYEAMLNGQLPED